MKNEENKQIEDQAKSTKEEANKDRQPANASNSPKKETLEERAKREHWTDVAESHLGIDE